MVLAVVACAAVLAALGGARPTGLGWLDAVLLGVTGAAMALAATEARSIPLYMGAAAPTLLQPAAIPRCLGAIAMVCVLIRHRRGAGAPVAAMAGGLSWAATVGAPFAPGATLIVLPVVGGGVVLLSARRAADRLVRQQFDRVALGVVGVALAGTALAVTAVVGARHELQRGIELLDAGLASARGGDADGAVDQLRLAHQELQRGGSTVGSPWARLGWLVPGVSQNLRAIDDLAEEAARVAAIGVRAVEEANVDALRARSGHIDLSAIAATEAPLSSVLAALQHADGRVGDVRSGWLLPPVRRRVDDAQERISSALPSAELALEAVRVAPRLLGGDGPRRYLVLFTTPVESRAITGFPGNFAELRFDQGAFSIERFGRAQDVNEGLPPDGGELRGVDEYVRRYGRFGPTREWQNVPVSPDFPTVASVAAQLYEQGGGASVDGVMSIDPSALGALLRLTGPVMVDGVSSPLDADNAPRYLQLDQYVEHTDVDARIDVLERLSRAVMTRLISVDLPRPQELGDLLAPMVAQKHLQLTSFDPAGQDLFDRMGASGRFPSPVGDLVGVTTTNTAGNKIDVFLRRRLHYDVTWDPDTGEVDATATISLMNDAPSTGLPDYLIGNARGARPLEPSLPPGWNSTFVTLYTPLSVVGATLDGQPTELENGGELGVTAGSAFVATPPGGRTTLIVRLHGTLPGPRYLLDVVAQPLVAPEQATIRIRLPSGESLSVHAPVTTPEEGPFPLVQDVRFTASAR